MKKLITPLCMLLISMQSFSQISIVKNIGPGSASGTPYILGTTSSGNLLFLANDGTNGFEIWTTDGTSGNTNMLVDMNPGATGSFAYYGSLMHNGKMYFTANDGTNGIEPWVTDGTAAGTFMLKDINAGSANSISVGYYNFCEMGGKIYFAANSGNPSGTELWETNGTTTGTNIVKNINTTANAGSDPRALQVAFGKLFFVANDGTSGYEWWTSDGTTGGTTRLADMNAGVANGVDPNAAGLVVMGSNAFFSGNNGGGAGFELFSTDGTSVSLVKDINTGAPNSDPRDFKVIDSKLYFAATTAAEGRELWVTDGTPSGTNIVKNIEPAANNSDPNIIGKVGTTFLFSASTVANGRELWKSDGTTINTTLLTDINTGAGNGHTVLSSENDVKPGAGWISNTFINNGKYYFAGDDGTNGRELWETDGTVAGTKMIATQIGVNPTNTISSQIDWIGVFNNKVWVRANDGNTGMELFKFDLPPIVNSVYTVNQEAFKIYPNPNNGSFVLQLANTDFAKGVIDVYDVTGRIVHTLNIKHATMNIVNLQDMPKGLYLAKVTIDGQTSTQRVTIQ